MTTKVEAAKICNRDGVIMIIANGSEEDVLHKITQGDNPGTVFIPTAQKLAGRKKWIAFNLSVQGKITVDKGAAAALLNKGTSLLACGIVEVEGDFSAGDVIDIIDQNGEELGRGLVNYSTQEVKAIKGLQSTEIKDELGYKDYDEVIHRDNLVCFFA